LVGSRRLELRSWIRAVLMPECLEERMTFLAQLFVSRRFSFICPWNLRLRATSISMKTLRVLANCP
jgi:hypothetical protein